MNIYPKILLATLPLVFVAFLGAVGSTYYLARNALNSVAEQWLATSVAEALQMTEAQLQQLREFSLDTIEVSVRQAQNDTKRAIGQIEIGELGYVYVVTREGVIASHPDASLVGRDVSGTDWFARIREAPEGRVHYGLDGTRYLAAYGLFAPWGWYVLAADPEEELYGAVNRMRLYGLVLAFGGSILIAVVLMLLTRLVTAPLRDLVAGAEQVGRGDLETRIPVTTADEMGVLARTFNQMIDQLRAQYESLEMRLGTVVSRAPIILFALDRAGTITRLEGQGLDRLGRDASSLLGRSIFDLHRDEADQEDVRRALGGATVSSHLVIEETVFETWYSPQRDADGAIVGVIGVGTDVTGRRRAEERLRRQNEYLAALNATTLGIVSRLQSTDLLQELVGRAAQLLSTTHGYIYLVRPDADRMERRVGIGAYRDTLGFRVRRGEGVAGRVWQSGEPVVVNDYQSWNGRIRGLDYETPMRALMAAPLASGGTVTGVIGIAYDVKSARRFGEEEVELLTRFAPLASIALDNARLYAAAEDARRAADAASEAKSAFLANVSHELRTPLTSVLGFTRMIQKRLGERILPLVPREDPKVRRAVSQVEENLGIILQEGSRLTALINNVLDLEKIEAGSMDWDVRPIGIGDVLQPAVAATASLFAEKGLGLRTEVEPGLPEALGDRDRLIQVVVNLLSNAVKFSDHGEVTCRAGLEATGAALVVSVTDRGEGIAPEDQEAVFEKFRQVGDTLTDKPTGSGLGLPICKEIVEHLGGRIWLESELGRGSTFYFSVPAAAARAAARSAEPSQP